MIGYLPPPCNRYIFFWYFPVFVAVFHLDDLHEARSFVAGVCAVVRDGVQGVQARAGYAHTQRGRYARGEF